MKPQCSTTLMLDFVRPSILHLRAEDSWEQNNPLYKDDCSEVKSPFTIMQLHFCISEMKARRVLLRSTIIHLFKLFAIIKNYHDDDFGRDPVRHKHSHKQNTQKKLLKKDV